jgi:hypothetical protein
MGFAYVVANIEGIEVFWSEDGHFLVKPNELCELPTDRMVKVIDWCKENNKLGHALEIFNHLGYKYNADALKASDLILISNGSHNDEKARQAAKKILDEI